MKREKDHVIKDIRQLMLEVIVMAIILFFATEEDKMDWTIFSMLGVAYIALMTTMFYLIRKYENKKRRENAS